MSYDILSLSETGPTTPHDTPLVTGGFPSQNTSKAIKYIQIICASELVI